jgi:hypothetical protein
MWGLIKRIFYRSPHERETNLDGDDGQASTHPGTQGEQCSSRHFRELLTVASAPDVASILTNIFAGTYEGYVLFKHGTVIGFKTCVDNLGAEACAILQENGPVLAGTPFGDFGVHELTLDRGFLVTSHHENLYTYVSAKQAPRPRAPHLAIGIYGREMRELDCRERVIIHIAKLNPAHVAK